MYRAHRLFVPYNSQNKIKNFLTRLCRWSW